jgi:hypothetical protein
MKKYLLLILVTLLLLLFVPITFSATLTDKNVFVVDSWSYSLDTYVGDISKTGTNSGTTYQSGILGQSRYFDGNDYITMPTNASFNNGAFSLCYFIKHNASITGRNVPSVWKGSGTGLWYIWSLLDEARDTTAFQTGGLSVSTHRVNIEEAPYKELAYNWSSWCYVANGTNVSIYKNGTLANSSAVTGTLSNDNSGIIFGKYSTTYLIGWLDEVVYWNTTITPQDVAEYDGNITVMHQGYPFNGTVLTNFTISGNDLFDGLNITNFSAFVNGTYYNTTTGVIITNYQNTGNLTNITIFSNQSGGYFSKEYQNFNTSVNLAFTLCQSYITFNATEIFTNASITTVNFTGYPGVNSSGLLCLKAGIMNITAYGGIYFQKNQSFTVTALQNDSQTIVDLAPARFKVYVYYSNGTYFPASNVTFNITYLNYSSYTEQYNYTGAGQFVYMPIGNYTINASGGNMTALASINSTTFALTTTTLNFTLYSSNSINFTFVDDVTGAVINESLSVNLISSIFSQNFTTATGSYYVDMLSPTIYTIRVTSTNYYESFYYLNLLPQSRNTVTIHLVNKANGTAVNATVYDELSNFVEGAYIKTLKYNVTSNTYDIHSIVKTNFEGMAQLYLFTNTEFYQFIIEYPFGTIKKVTEPSYIYGNSIYFIITLNNAGGSDDFATQSLVTDLAYNNGTQVFSFFYDDKTLYFDEFCFTLYESTNNIETYKNVSCNTAPSSTILLPLYTPLNGSKYIAKATAIKGLDVKFLNSIVVEFGGNATTLGTLGLFLMAILVIVFALIGSWNPIATILLPPFAITLSLLFGLVSFGWWIPISIHALSIIASMIIHKYS